MLLTSEQLNQFHPKDRKRLEKKFAKMTESQKEKLIFDPLHPFASLNPTSSIYTGSKKKNRGKREVAIEKAKRIMHI